ncbi:MAG: ferrochelatase [Bryobacteraceae bacterium]|nr:ferrochelatase [Bryobacteraceae bacterium]
MSYDAILLLSFGGPEAEPDVIPFLENVLRGRNVPRERMLEVAEHYYHYGGKSPINDQNRSLLTALKQELADHGLNLPVYWGNRNWHPLLADTVTQMKQDGVRRVLCFVTSSFGSYSGCRQYRENIEAARAGAGEGAPEIDKLRHHYNHPGFIETMSIRVRAALEEAGSAAALVFTAHSIPVSMAESGPYVAQLEEASRLVAESVGKPDWRLVYQSRSGPPGQPWLEPDISDSLRQIRSEGADSAVVAPIGFISDHMEVLYDLDTEAQAVCREIGLKMVRAGTAGCHPRFVRMIRELIEERMHGAAKQALGVLGPYPDTCPAGCCPPPKRPSQP